MQVWFSNKIRGHPQGTSNYEGEGGFENQGKLGIGGKWFGASVLAISLVS